ncbi:MAG TPA: MFS transporter [Herpetosiphonaceae bacterium]
MAQLRSIGQARIVVFCTFRGRATLSNQSQIEAPTPAPTPIGFSAEMLKESLVQDTAPPPPPEANQPVTYRQILRNRNFRLLWMGQAVTTFGSFFTRVAIPIYVYTLTGSYGHLGLSFFVTNLPQLLFGLFAGALVDRWDRRRTMISTDLVNFVLLCSLVAVIVLPDPVSVKLGAIYAITFCSAILRELFNPARIAIFTEVVDEKSLLTANSLDQSSQTLGELLSYPVAAYLLLKLGPALAFGVDAASFLLSALLIWGVKVKKAPVAETAETSSIWRDMRAGLTAVNKSSLLRKIVLLSFVVPMIFMLLGALTLPFAVEKLGSTAEVGFPALEGALALGVTVGMLALGYWGQNIPRWKLLAMGLFGFGVCMILVGLVPRIGAALGIEASTLAFDLDPTSPENPWTVLLMMAIPLVFLQGATNSLLFTCIRTVMQEEAPRAMIGRVASVVGVASGVGYSIGALMTKIGEGRADTVISIIGAILLSIGIFSFWWLRVPPRTSAPVAPPMPEQSF